MFCPKCGTKVEDGSSICPKCGNTFGQRDIRQSANDAFTRSENELRDAFNDVRSTVSGGGGPNPGERLKTDRSLLAYIILTLITCGIYSYYFLYKMAKDVNVACEGDGASTAGLLQFVVLSYLTCGIYAWIWYYNLGNRLADNAPRYGMAFQENGTTVLLWQIFGLLLCGLGPLFAMNILIKNTNRICQAYNQYNHL